MTLPIHNRKSFLITSRFFPPNLTLLTPVLNKSYIEMSSATNDRTNGVHETVESVTGEKWLQEGNPLIVRQSFRKVFNFLTIAQGTILTINHGIIGLFRFTKTYGECTTDVPDFRSIPYSSTVSVTQNISTRRTNTQIIIRNGTNAPNIVDGIITLEYFINRD